MFGCCALFGGVIMQTSKLVAIMLLISITLLTAANGMSGVNKYVRARVNRSRNVRARGRNWLVFDDYF